MKSSTFFKENIQELDTIPQKFILQTISSLKVRNLYVKYVNDGITIFCKINRSVPTESIYSILILHSNY